RSQSTGDRQPPCLLMLPQASFNLRREANPLATTRVMTRVAARSTSFNLRREANPLGTDGSYELEEATTEFQSQARSQSTGDVQHGNAVDATNSTFQSQARSQSTGDSNLLPLSCSVLPVSISGEKPIHWRRAYPDEAQR